MPKSSLRYAFSFVVLLAACGSSQARPAAASKPVVTEDGFRSLGAACAFDRQCASGACSGDRYRRGVGSCGVCITERAPGDSCRGPTEGCSSAAKCVDGICKTSMKGLGERCSSSEAVHLGCDPALYCREDKQSSNGACAKRPARGEACINGERCATGTICLDDVCVAKPLPRVAGDGCSREAPCAEGLACRSFGSEGVWRCEALRVLAPGAACRSDEELGTHLAAARRMFGIEECPQGTECKAKTYGVPQNDDATFCLPQQREGALCAFASCAEGFECDRYDWPRPTEAHCRRLGNRGEPCSQSGLCAVGLECRSDVCETPCR